MASGKEDGLSELDRLFRYAIEHALLDDPKGQWALQAWQLGLKDPKVRELIEGRVHEHKRRLSLRGVPFAEVQLPKGQIDLGLDPTKAGRRLKAALKMFAAHTLVIATTGAGKTTRNYFMALQMGRLVRAVWLFDLRKREWRRLRPYFQRLGKDLVVVPGRALKINPLQCPYAVDPADWAAVCAQMLTSVLHLPNRASRMLQTVIYCLYQQHGVIDGGESYPTLWDVYQAVKLKRDANPQSRAAVVDNLEPVLLSLRPEVLGYRYGWRTRDLAQHSLAFEMTGLTETDQNLLLNTLLLGEFTSRIAQGASNVPLDLWMCLDEAQRLCAAGNQHQDDVLGDLIGLTRGVGIGLDLSAQSTHGLSPHVLSNTNIKMIGRCGSYADITAIGSCMGLSAEQMRFIQQRLVTGMFVTQLGDGGERRPFLCQLPPIDLGLDTESDSSDPPTGGTPEPLRALPVASC